MTLESATPTTPRSADTASVISAFPRTKQTWRTAIGRIFGQLTQREDRLFLLLAVMIGIFAGLIVVCFRMAIEYTHLWLLGSSETPSIVRLLLAPTLTGLFVAFLVKRFFPAVRGSGVNQTKIAMYVSNGYIPFHTVYGKFLCSAIVIGGGHSLGPEDPSLQIGAGIASVIGRRLRLSREKLRLIAPVGAAAGLAAAFNSPIAAVIFVIEEIVGRWSSGILGAVVLSAVSAVVVMRSFLGAEALFRIPAFRLEHPAELLGYAVLGVVGGVFSLYFVKLVAWLRAWFRRWPEGAQFFQPAIAGLLLGVMGIWLPQVLGAGYEVMDQSMRGRYIWQFLALLAVAKVLATCLSFASGAPGGMFAPTLFIGAMLGGAVGGFEHHFFPALTASPGAYALVGMGTLFAGFLRVPMTSVFMVLEVSGNYSIILPVMISNTIAYIISLRYQQTPVFDLLSKQDGMDLPSLEEVREEEQLTVEDGMHPAASVVLNTFTDIVEDIRSVVSAHPQDWYLIRDLSTGWHLVPKHEISRCLTDLPPTTRFVDVFPQNPVPFVHPDLPLDAPLRKFGIFPFLPVVRRTDLGQLVGLISRDDVLNTYARAGEPLDLPNPS